MYLREMGTVPLLTREGEVEIAKRIERGKLAVIKSISRTPTIARAIIDMGEQLRAGKRTIRELVIFNDEEITDERVEERAREVSSRSTPSPSRTATGRSAKARSPRCRSARSARSAAPAGSRCGPGSGCRS
jgi:RNA polymerase primary sigma factor